MESQLLAPIKFQYIVGVIHIAKVLYYRLEVSEFQFYYV